MHGQVTRIKRETRADQILCSGLGGFLVGTWFTILVFYSQKLYLGKNALEVAIQSEADLQDSDGKLGRPKIPEVLL